MSFMRFLGLTLADRVPDARTIWLFREKLTKAKAIEPLFARFDAALRASGYIALSGQIAVIGKNRRSRFFAEIISCARG